MSSWLRQEAEQQWPEAATYHELVLLDKGHTHGINDADGPDMLEGFGLLVLAEVERLIQEKLVIYDGHRGPIVALIRSLREDK